MISTYWADKIMARTYTNSEHEFWIGLSSTLPKEDGSNVSEPSGAGYSRVQIEGFSEPDAGCVYNINALVFPESTSTWFPYESRAAYWTLFDGSGADASLLACGELHTPLTIEANTVVSVDIGELCVTLTDYTFG